MLPFAHNGAVRADQEEELIKKIAAKHGTAVSRDDPILVLQTINKRLLQESTAAQQAQLDQFKQEMEALTLRWENDAKAKAERILNAALAAGKDALWQTMQEAGAATVLAVRLEIDAALARVADPLREARRIGMFNVVASCITLLAGEVILWVARRH